jgi:hypothetical protein
MKELLIFFMVVADFYSLNIDLSVEKSDKKGICRMNVIMKRGRV